MLLWQVVIFYIPIHKVLEQPWRHFTSLKRWKCFQIPHLSTRVSSTFCRWHTLRSDTSYKGRKPFLPILKLLSFTCVICCNWRLFFSDDSIMFRDFLFPSVLQFGIIISHRCKQNNLFLIIRKYYCTFWIKVIPR